jgi:Tol biopolymer transport system component
MQSRDKRRLILRLVIEGFIVLALAVILAGPVSNLLGTVLGASVDMAPRWSPNADYVVFESTRNGSRDIYMVEVKTGKERRLTDSPAQDVNPSWSPSNDRIVFQSDRDGLWQIYELELASNQLQRLSDGKYNDENPQYSSDGQWISFNSVRDSGKNVIFVMAADGSGTTAISDPGGNSSNKVWSPQGHKITYQSDLNGTVEIYVYDIDTDKRDRVSTNLP